ncbi:stage II sporulation protein E [Clostridium tunisiense]|uniref:stage II sporulation protein E n=1 Tax=Clostridium tunisiense TaxID=219748 RepID=UPI0002F191EC|nr:stage II sporulation protein E [Clostridium tunisiense]
MQYGAELRAYERIKKSKEVKNNGSETYNKVLVKSIAFLVMSILISRTMLINKSAPFGVAFLVVVLLMEDNKISLVTSLGAILGYITLKGTLDNTLMYVTLVPTITLVAIITNNFLKKSTERMLLGFVTMTLILGYNILIREYSTLMALGITFIELLCIVPVYFIIDYSISCFKEINTKHLFSNEELISMSILVSLMVAGMWNVNIFGISLLNIFSLFIVLGISYICGSTVGAASGIAMGVIVGMSNNTIFVYASMLGICGLVGGLFKEGGKLLALLSSLVVFSIMKIYTISYNLEGSSQFMIIEAVITAIGFLAIPQSIYQAVINEVDSDKKGEAIDQNYVEKIRGIFVDRLDQFSEVLLNMSNILTDLADNDKLDMKSKSSALIENLANRVCGNCNTNCICWNREMHHTYSAFGELLEVVQGNGGEFPQELERKCIKKASLIRNAEDIVNKYIISEMWRSRLAEGRELLANQFNNMAKSVEEIVDEFASDLKEDKESEKNIMRMLDKHGIEYNDVFCINDKKGRLTIQLTTKSCDGLGTCVKTMLPLINDSLGKSMMFKEDGCRIDPITKICTATFEEATKFQVKTYAARQCKDGQTTYGDSFSFGRAKDGSYMMVLSDGMGSGPQAGRESEAAVELIEKFTGAGFSKTTAINTVNSIMTLKFSEEEKFSTVDLSSIDLYTGEIDFMKVGAVASIIKSDDTVDIIKSKTLPIGILDKADIEVHKKKLKHGDVVIMLSDGVLDYDDESCGKVDWVLDYICRNEGLTPRDLAEGIVEEAKKLSGNKVKDDMTVVVSKVYSAAS